MKKVIVTMVLAAMAGGAYAADFGALAVSAPALAASVEVKATAPSPEAVPGTTLELFMDEYACKAADAVLAVQPTRVEAVKMLKPCFAAISKTNMVRVRIERTGLGLLITVGANPDRPGANEAVAEKLKRELAQRQNRLLGYDVFLAVAQVQRLSETKSALFMGLRACSVADDMFFVQPSKAEAIKMMRPCFSAVSMKYGVPVTASETNGGLSLLVGLGDTDNYHAFADLSASLRSRGGMLFGYPAEVHRLDNAPY